MIENYINKVLNGDTIDVMSEMPEGWVDLVVTSPPYNVGIQYDTHNDEIFMDEYWEWSEKWLT
jgi:site-specific DNA-methyltransferase (adenine-specific)